MPGDYATIQEAMDAAEPGDTVTVAPGTYDDVFLYEDPPWVTVRAVVVLKPGVTLLGRPEAPGTVIITAGDTAAGVFCHGVDSTASIVGFTLSGCRTGIEGRDASPTIDRCRLEANHTASPSGTGAGMLGTAFSPQVTDCAFIDNTAGAGAGASFWDDSFPVLRRCSFTGNIAANATTGAGFGGGLIVAQHSSAELIDCTFAANRADSVGGGILISNSTVRITGGSITGNQVQEGGGGIHCCAESVLELVGVTISGNTAFFRGGGIHCLSGVVVDATDCTIRDNGAIIGADGDLQQQVHWPLVTLMCCDVDPEAWAGETLVIDDSACEK